MSTSTPLALPPSPLPFTVLHQALNDDLRVHDPSPLAATGHPAFLSIRTSSFDHLVQAMCRSMPPVAPAPRSGRNRYAAPIPPAPVAPSPPVGFEALSPYALHFLAPSVSAWDVVQPWLSRLATQRFTVLRANLPALMAHFGTTLDPATGQPVTASETVEAVEAADPRSGVRILRGVHGLRRPCALHRAEHSPWAAWCDRLACVLFNESWSSIPCYRQGLMLPRDRVALDSFAREVHGTWGNATGRPVDLTLRSWTLNPVMRGVRPVPPVSPDRPLDSSTPTSAPPSSAASLLAFDRAPVLHRLAENPDWAENPAQGLGLARALLGLEANVTGVEHHQRSVLHLAVERGLVPLTTLLLDAGAPINACTRTGERALHLAVQNDHLDLARVLIARGSRQNLGPGHTDHLGALDAVMARRLVHLIVDRSHRLDPNEAVAVESNVRVTPSIGPSFTPVLTTTPLHWAVAGGRPNLVAWLVARGADPSRCNDEGDTVWDLADRINTSSVGVLTVTTLRTAFVRHEHAVLNGTFGTLDAEEERDRESLPVLDESRSLGTLNPGPNLLVVRRRL